MRLPHSSTMARSCGGQRRPASDGVAPVLHDLDERPDAGGRDSCGTTAPSSPPLEADCARPSRTVSAAILRRPCLCWGIRHWPSWHERRPGLRHSRTATTPGSGQSRRVSRCRAFTPKMLACVSETGFGGSFRPASRTMKRPNARSTDSPSEASRSSSGNDLALWQHPKELRRRRRSSISSRPRPIPPRDRLRRRTCPPVELQPSAPRSSAVPLAHSPEPRSQRRACASPARRAWTN